MRILYLNPSGQLGGAETSLIELLAAVRAAEPEWELWLVLGQDGPLSARARELGVKVEVLPFPESLARLGDSGSGVAATLAGLVRSTGATALYARRLGALLGAARPQIIHTNGLKMHVLGAVVRPKDVRLVWHIHDYVRARRMMSRLLVLFRWACNAAIVNSHSVAADLKTLLPSLRAEVIYNAVNLSRFSPSGPTVDLDALAGLAPAPRGTVRVGMVATFAKWKGHRVFLDALARIPGDSQIRGYVIGGPIYQTGGSQWSLADLKKEAEAIELSGRVGFTGFLEDPAAALRSLDIVVHASTQPEPFGMVIIEGMASERAVIASQTGGAAELFTDGENALGHTPGDANSLALAIERLASEPVLRERLSRAGRAHAEQHFHRERLAAQVVSLYREIATAAGPVRGKTMVAAPFHPLNK